MSPRRWPHSCRRRSFIGFACGTFCYFLNFPSVFASDSHRPRKRGAAAAAQGALEAGEARPEGYYLDQYSNRMELQQ